MSFVLFSASSLVSHVATVGLCDVRCTQHYNASRTSRISTGARLSGSTRPPRYFNVNARICEAENASAV
ncbi:hypothetical protein OUZ56_031060 [Daphnia magna]|uniref:Secreted protein n=1 Tax=Daphnia magna TaxID=35525 RepID=A0ABQ9ZT49_9CRUS|nr:hypothetical protein OUZ56_031060 [Daphnia magna]